MDYMNFDNDTCESDDDYFAFVAWLTELTAAELSVAKHGPEEQKSALCRYYQRGERANLTAEELIDFLGVSTPSIFDLAGYTDEETDAAMLISDSLTDEEIQQASLPDVIT